MNVAVSRYVRWRVVPKQSQNWVKARTEKKF